MNNQELAAKITREIFELGDEPNMPTWRIQFMGGSFGNEKPQGGICEKSLAGFIKESLDKLRVNVV